MTATSDKAYSFNPMTTVNDLIVGGTGGAPLRLAAATLPSPTLLTTLTNGVSWVAWPTIQAGPDLSIPVASNRAGNMYVATDTRAVYMDNGSGWSLPRAIRTGLFSSVPATGASHEGDIYFATDRGILYIYASGAWVSQGSNAGYGTLAARPAVGGIYGNMYYATDQGVLYVSAGSTWETPHAIVLKGIRSAIPVPTPGAAGLLYYETDANLLYLSTGTAWVSPDVAIYVGTDSLRPTAGYAGKMYYATDTKILYVDNGTAWVYPAMVLLGGRPASGTSGRLHLNTTSRRLSVDIGSGWVGTSSVQFGALASRPAAGDPGLAYYATDAGTLTVDNGTAWQSTFAVTREGTLASRPAPGNAGSFYFGIDTLLLYVDTGTAWNTVSTTTGGGGGTAGGTGTTLQQVRVTAAQPSISFPNVAQGQTNLMLVLTGHSTAIGADTDTLLLALNGDTTATKYHNEMVAGGGGSPFASQNYLASNALTRIAATGGSTPLVATPLILSLPSYDGSTFHKSYTASGTVVGTSKSEVYALSGVWDNNAPITRIDLTLVSGQFAAGTVATLYATGYTPGTRPVPYTDAVLVDLPTAYWRMDEQQYAFVYDSSGNGHTATNQGAATDQNGLPSGGTAMRGNNGGKVLLPVTMPNVGSAEFWFKTRDAASAKTTIWADTILLIETASGILRQDSPDGFENSAVSYADGAWHHVVYSFSETTSLLDLWVDGGQVLNKIHYQSGAAVSAVRYSRLFIFENGTGTSFPYNGSLAHVAIYPAPLAPARIVAHYMAGKALGPTVVANLPVSALTLIQEQVPGGQTIATFPNIPQGYEDLELRINSFTAGGVAADAITVIINGDSSGSYSYERVSTVGATATATSTVNATSAYIGTLNGNNDAAGGGFITTVFQGYSVNLFKTYTSTSFYRANNQTDSVNGCYTATDPITQIDIRSTNNSGFGNLGTFSLYGRGGLGQPGPNPMQQPGDLIVGGANGAATRLGINVDGNVLTQVNGVPTWQSTLSSSPGALVPLQEIGVVGTATNLITFSNIPITFRSLLLDYGARTNHVATSAALLLQCNSDSGSNYASFGGDGASSGTSVRIGNVDAASSPANGQGIGSIQIPYYTSAIFNKRMINTHAYAGSTVQTNAGTWGNQGNITSLTLFVTGGFFVAGSTFTLWGVASTGQVPTPFRADVIQYIPGYDYSFVAADDKVLADASNSGTGMRVYLTDAIVSTKTLVVKRMDASGNFVLVQAQGTQTIDGQSSVYLSERGESISLTPYNGNWIIT